MKKQSEINLNQIRYKIILKGIMNISDIQAFLNCGYNKAKKIYDEIEEQILKEKKRVSSFGILSSRFLEYTGFDEKQIRQYAIDEADLLFAKYQEKKI